LGGKNLHADSGQKAGPVKEDAASNAGLRPHSKGNREQQEQEGVTGTSSDNGIQGFSWSISLAQAL
jgi:hypothetical protein